MDPNSGTCTALPAMLKLKLKLQALQRPHQHLKVGRLWRAKQAAVHCVRCPWRNRKLALRDFSMERFASQVPPASTEAGCRMLSL